jgi:hypothetical protein
MIMLAVAFNDTFIHGIKHILVGLPKTNNCFTYVHCVCGQTLAIRSKIIFPFTLGPQDCLAQLIHIHTVYETHILEVKEVIDIFSN